MNKLLIYQIVMFVSGLALVGLAWVQQYCDNWIRMTEQTQIWLNSSYLGLGWSLITSIIVIFLYNRVQESVKEQELVKRRKTALRLSYQPIKSLLGLLVAIYYATTVHYNKPNDVTIQEFFDEEYFNNSIHLDFGKPLYPNEPYLSHLTWFEPVSEHFNKLTNITDMIIRKYSDYLDPDMVELIENINTSFFVRWAKELPNSFDRYNQNEILGLKIPYLYPGRMNGTVPDQFKEFINDFIALIELYNRWADDDKRIEFSPKSAKLGNALLEPEQLEYQEQSIQKSLKLHERLKKFK